MPSAYGPMSPEDSSSEFNVISFIIQRALDRVRTIIPAQVKAVHGGGIGVPPTVDVLPLVNMLDGNGNATPHVTIFGVPAVRLQAGTFAFIADPVVGDLGVLLLCDRDISSVKSTSAQANPGSFRRFDFADGIYLGGILGTQTPQQYIEFTSTGMTILDALGNMIQTSATGMVLTTKTGGVVNIVATALQVNGIPVTVP